MSHFSTVFGLLSRKSEPLSRELFESAYTANTSTANTSFWENIDRKDYEGAERTLFKVLLDYGLFRRQLTRDANEDENVIPNRQALIMLWVRAKGYFRKYNKERPAAYHSIEVTEIFLLMAKQIVDRLGRSPPWFRALVRQGVRTSLLHDMVEDFNTGITEIVKFFGDAIAQSVSKMTRPDIVELVLDPRLREIAKTYIAVPESPTNQRIKELLDDLKGHRVSTYVNLKARLQLQWNLAAVHGYTVQGNSQEGLTLMECLSRGADNIHAIISDTIDLRKGIIRLQRPSDLTVYPDIPGQPIVVNARLLQNSLADRANYQTELYIRINELKKQASKPDSGISPADLQIFDIAKEVLIQNFENAKTKLDVEINFALGVTEKLAAVKHSVTARIVEAVVDHTTTASTRFARMMRAGAVL